MKITRTLIAALALGLVAAILPPTGTSTATGQDVYNRAIANILNAEPVSANIATDDTDVALIVKYVGPSAGMTSTSNSGKVEVTAGTITFTSGASGAEVADTSLECPISGALGGVIDITNAACDTIGEVLDIVNAPSSNFRAVALDALRADVSTNLFIQAATAANSVDGLNLKWDTSDGFDTTANLTPYRTMGPYLSGRNLRGGAPAGSVYANYRGIVLKANATSTYASGTSTFEVHSVLPGIMTSAGGGSETDTVLYAEAGGATTVNKVFDFTPYGVACAKNAKCIIKLNNSAAGSAVVLRGYGIFVRYQ